MASFSCALCRQQVPVSAKLCPHCGKNPRNSATDAASPGCVVAGLMLIVCAAGLAWYFGGSFSLATQATPATKAVPTAQHSDVGAFGACQDLVRQRLKTPRTAKFPWGVQSSDITHLGSGQYRVRSYVDAQNDFGAMIRTNYDCTVQWQGSDRWRLLSLTM